MKKTTSLQDYKFFRGEKGVLRRQDTETPRRQDTKTPSL